MAPAVKQSSGLIVDAARGIEGTGEAVIAPPSAPHFLVHNEGDDVAVAVQDVAPGEARIVHLDSGRSFGLAILEGVPLGHKAALKAIAAGSDVIEYGVRVGRARGAIQAGQLVHVHNLRSARWERSQ
ncbi:MAG: UxaA family hydrolase [Candidatus Dormibacteraceae bacterium]